MSNQSNNQGRAYEYICAIILAEEIKKVRPVIVLINSALNANKKAWESLSTSIQQTMTKSAKATISTIFDMEPLIFEKGNDLVTIAFQTDEKGKFGDVRDIIISRNDIKWEIGLSIKHNHFAVKHSRLSKNLDFGKKWYNVPCSKTYWSEINPIFEYLENQKALTKKWSELPSKDTDVYIPILNSFKSEILRSYTKNKKIPQKMVEYLLGEFDFYKLISLDNSHITKIQTYNLHGTLNKKSKTSMPKIYIPIASLPTRIVSFDFKPNSTTTLELYMDGGWQFNFRIHNASAIVEPSLKFDIQIIGMPSAIITINCNWN